MLRGAFLFWVFFFFNPIVTVTLQGSSYNQHFTSQETGSRKLNNLSHVIQLMRGGARIQTQLLGSYPPFKVRRSAGNRRVQVGKIWLWDGLLASQSFTPKTLGYNSAYIREALKNIV